jgi:arsenate reductase
MTGDKRFKAFWGNKVKKVLFACVHNSGRSQMAEAFFNHLAGKKAKAVSAGTKPAAHMDRNVVEAMLEIGMNIRRQRPKLLTPGMLQEADLVITMGCGVADTCPVTFTPAEVWEFEDPEGKPLERVRQIRDQIKVKVAELVKNLSG